MSSTTPLTPPKATFPVAIIMERRLHRGNRWASHSWEAVAVVGGRSVAEGANGTRSTPLHADDEVEQFLWQGFSVDLYVDATESYWHNLMSPTPVLCVICQPGEGGDPVPVTVTADYDQASAGMEADDAVFAVPMPPEIYRWLEAFVVEHFRPTERKTRKRKRWVSEEQNDSQSPRLQHR